MKPEHLAGITINPNQCGDRPCLRIRVTDILGLPGSGASNEEILADYPYLDREDILAAIESG